METFSDKARLRDFLEKKVLEFNDPSFIPYDPVSVPHRFRIKQDIEIAGLFAAIFAWGNRTTIIRKSNELMRAMDDAPYDFILNHRPRDLKRLADFKHRTFNTTDLYYFIEFLKSHYRRSDTLETAFIPENSALKSDGGEQNEFMESALNAFYRKFFSLKHVPERTRKHIADPERNSTCKRLNMYLRWMVRKDDAGVDFGIWERMSPADLVCPVDLHVARVGRRLGLIQRAQTDWLTAMELTRELRNMDRKDPVKFDFALFGMGVSEKN